MAKPLRRLLLSPAGRQEVLLSLVSRVCVVVERTSGTAAPVSPNLDPKDRQSGSVLVPSALPGARVVPSPRHRLSLAGTSL
ncbi:hypothetical protein H920_03409 [Fukomys damarensis]|uniref:Uncharacterized protein n=1 Tax=Fukomys damarensis TaxID=885580 RepID=A0A091DT19_FUKDA|nr:hypothetical protein H920_03409 [Fukomys damarensis]